MPQGAPAGGKDSRGEALARLHRHRGAFDDNPALRILYQRWYGRLRDLLPDRAVGPWMELGAGPGLSQAFIPELHLTDVVRAPWHGLTMAAEALPFVDGSVGALVLFDVLHHLPRPSGFFAEAARVLRSGGRVVLCEPYVSPVSYPIYRFVHEEGLDFSVDPLTQALAGDKDPFAGNQAIPTLLLGKFAGPFAAAFPALKVVHFERLAGFSYPAAGGFGRAPFLPLSLWRWMDGIEARLPAVMFRAIGFRLMAAIEKR